MKRRAITLIELLLAIGLLVVLGGIVLPAVFTGLRERAFESTGEVIRNQLLLARAHAQATRRPVEVVYDHRPNRSARVGARYFPVGLDDRQQQADPRYVIVESWADRGLPDGLRLADPRGAAPPDDEPRSLRLAVYMPDGSALLTRPAWVLDDHGRRGRLEVNPWTGLPSFKRIFGDEDGAPDESQENQDVPDDTDREQQRPPDFGSQDEPPAPPEKDPEKDLDAGPDPTATGAPVDEQENEP